MTAVVGRIVRQGPNRKSIFVPVLGISQKRRDEIPTAKIVCKIAEKLITVRVIAHVLNNRPAISIGMSFPQILGGGVREALQEQRTNVGVPHDIDDGLVSQDRIGSGWRRTNH